MPHNQDEQPESPSSSHHAEDQAHQPFSDPTVEEIQQACSEIQAKWSERKRRRRRLGSGRSILLDVVASNELGISE